MDLVPEIKIIVHREGESIETVTGHHEEPAKAEKKEEAAAEAKAE
jgi:hypothetical protein